MKASDDHEGVEQKKEEREPSPLQRGDGGLEDEVERNPERASHHDEKAPPQAGRQKNIKLEYKE